MQNKISERIDTRYTPRIRFELDEGVIALSRDGSEIPFSPQEAARLPLVQGELDTVRRTFLTLSAMMPVDMHAHVAEMYVQDGTITLRGRAGETVLLGDATNLVKKVDIAADLLRRRRYMVIDVRFPSSPTVRTGE